MQATTSVLIQAALLASAQSGGDDGRRGPPPESLAACKGSVGGKECTFNSPRGTVSGTCWAPEGKPLGCRQKDAPGTAASQPKP